MDEAEAIRLLLYDASTFWEDNASSRSIDGPNRARVDVVGATGAEFQWAATLPSNVLSSSGSFPTLAQAKQDVWDALRNRLVRLEESLLRQRLVQAGNRHRAETYLDLAHDLISVTGLTDDDPRLVMRMGIGGSLFDITINKWSALAAERGYVYRDERPYIPLAPPAEHEVEFILSGALEGHIRQLPNALGYSKYKSDPPTLWARFAVPPILNLKKEVQEDWRNTLRAIANRGRRSHARKYHQPVLFDAVTDPRYRDQLLAQVAWPSQQEKGTS